MTLDREKLRSDLEKLHNELRQIESVDERERAMLCTLDSDIEKLLSGETDELPVDRETRERLSEGLAFIEASHPRITLLLRQMVDSLAYLGV